MRSVVATAGVGKRFGIPWLIVRALSDRAGEESAVEFGPFLASAATSAAGLVRVVVPLLAQQGR